MHIILIIRILGYLMLFLSGAMLLPIPFSLFYGDSDYFYFLLSSGISAFLGIIIVAILGKQKKEMRPKEGFAVVTFGWIMFSVIGALPAFLSGEIPSFTDAFFETMSGFSTTGATILTDIESLSHGILFWRSLTHWLGGMGIIMLSIAILPFLGVGGMQLFKAEVPGPVVDKLKPRMTETAKLLWGVYLLLTIVETILLMFGGMSLFESLCHSFGTMATGGFSTKNASIAAYGSAYLDYVIIIFMFIAGTNFSLHYQWMRGNFKDVYKNQELRTFALIIGIATILIGIDTFFNIYTNFWETLQFSLFQVLSIITTTGYGTADYESWAVSSQLILFFLMFVGGSAGSTGGGIKVLRTYLLFKFIYGEFVRLLHPQAVVPIRYGSTVVDRSVMMNVLGFFVLYLLLTVIGVIVVSAFNYDLATSFGAVAATINNIGPGLGQVGPTDNYAHFPDALKWILSFFMLAGRLEIFTVIILLSPGYWKK
jgi:trk system potassium uptake protein TrkH